MLISAEAAAAVSSSRVVVVLRVLYVCLLERREESNRAQCEKQKGKTEMVLHNPIRSSILFVVKFFQSLRISVV